MSQVKFQKRHFEYIAKILKDYSAPIYVVEGFAGGLSSTNANFKWEKFIEASTAAPNTA